MEPADEIPKKKKKKGTIEFFLRSKRMKFRRIEYFSFFSFFRELLYSRKNARAVIRHHTNIRAFHSPGNSFGWDVMVAQGRGEKPVQHEQWEYQNYRGAPARTTNDPLILWTAHTER